MKHFFLALLMIPWTLVAFMPQLIVKLRQYQCQDDDNEADYWTRH